MAIYSNIEAHVDSATTFEVTGWAVDWKDLDRILTICIIHHGDVISESVANLRRDDLTNNKRLKNSNHAFQVELPEIFSDGTRREINVLIKEIGKNITKYPMHIQNDISSGSMGSKRRSYQSWGDSDGDSQSILKLERLRLPPLNGLRVLDIGCNEGYFCNFAISKGAAHVVGLDSNPDVINEAKIRTPQAQFICTNWWDLPDEEFDIILFLSAIHYEKNQKSLLNYLGTRLSKDGVLILECGVHPHHDSHWYYVQRHDDKLRYPNELYLLNHLLPDFCVTPMGQSVDQSGDPIPRFVYHCRRLNPTFLLVTGKSGTGKTYLSRAIASNNKFSIYSTDDLFHRLIREHPSPKGRLLSYIESTTDLMNLDTLSSKLVSDGYVDDLVSLIIGELPFDSRISLVEGEILEHPTFREALATAISSNNGVVWVVSRQDKLKSDSQIQSPTAILG